MTTRLASLCVDANDPVRIARFWASALGWEIDEEADDEIVLIPTDGTPFDLVIGRQVLHHARDLSRLCREVARVLRPGGTFVAAREHVISRQEDLQAFLDAHPLHRLYGGEHAYPVAEYLRAIEGAGIRLTMVLNPYASDVNLFPETTNDIKAAIARRLKLPTPRLIPRVALRVLGAISDTPGRPYTFIGRKPLR